MCRVYVGQRLAVDEKIVQVASGFAEMDVHLCVCIVCVLSE